MYVSTTFPRQDHGTTPPATVTHHSPPRVNHPLSTNRGKNDKNTALVHTTHPHPAYAGKMVQPLTDELQKVTTWIADTRDEIRRAAVQLRALGLIIAGLLAVCAGALLALVARP